MLASAVCHSSSPPLNQRFRQQAGSHIDLR